MRCMCHMSNCFHIINFICFQCRLVSYNLEIRTMILRHFQHLIQAIVRYILTRDQPTVMEDALKVTKYTCTVLCFCEAPTKLLLFFSVYSSCRAVGVRPLPYNYFSSISFISYGHCTGGYFLQSCH